MNEPRYVAASALRAVLAKYLAAGESSLGSFGPVEAGPLEDGPVEEGPGENGPVLDDIPQA